MSDAEREHVGQLLQRAVGMGMLSLGEFTERMDTTLAAKTRGELNAVLADLPGMRVVDNSYAKPAPPVPPGFAQPRRAAHRPPDPGTHIRGRMTNIVRKGPWHVPPTLYLNDVAASVTLDFSEAIMQTQVVEIQIDDFCSNVTLIVPAAATVDVNGMETIGGSATNKVRTGPPIGPLHLVVRGRMRFGSVTAKHPFGTAFRRMMAPNGLRPNNSDPQ